MKIHIGQYAGAYYMTGVLCSCGSDEDGMHWYNPIYMAGFIWLEQITNHDSYNED